MKTKNIFKTVALAMLMPTMLLTTACSNQDDVANTSNITDKGYALPVTVNATRGDGATRASFEGGKLNFGAGDKLFVYSYNQSISGAGTFAGTLDYVPATGKFSGTIYTENEYDNTADALFTAAAAVVEGPTHIKAYLLPAGYEGKGYLSIYDNGTSALYDDQISINDTKAFVASETAKATGVEQLSLEEASTYSTGFALEPQKAILNFTITGLNPGEKNVDLVANYGYYGGPYHVTGKVTPNASGVATFAIGVPAGATLENMDNNLTVGSNSFTLPSSTTFTAGKIYNIARYANAISGKFSISATKQVYFSKGNLQYTKNTGKWSFMTNQYSTVETLNQSVGTNYASQNVVSLFGWGTSGSAPSGQTARDPYYTNAANTDYVSNITTTGESWGTGSEWDWGTAAASDLGSGWRTLTKDEWTYLFNTRSASTVNGTADGRYAKAKVNNVMGVILFPDTYTHPDDVTDPTGVNATDNTGWNDNNYTVADWTKMESAGCVFLPAAGYRSGPSVYDVGSLGGYWSSTAYSTSNAYYVHFNSGTVIPANNSSRYRGYSVRLVREVTE